MKVRQYENYDDYINFQKIKTEDPEKRKRWLGEEWGQKIAGFKQAFEKLEAFLSPEKRCLCIGARTGQEVVALNEMGVVDVTGIDIVPHDPYVIEGDMHNLDFEDDSFDLVYTNILGYSINPKKMISEIERVLKIGGLLYLQVQINISQNEYTEFIINNPLNDIVTLFDKSFCTIMQPIIADGSANFAGMNYEFVFRKDKNLSELFDNSGSIKTIVVPDDYNRVWEKINLDIQEWKLSNAEILDTELRNSILGGLKRRAYYLTRIAKQYDCKKIIEVGTAEGWQFYSFGLYAKDQKGMIVSCDPRDVRNKEYSNLLEPEYCKYVQGTSSDISKLDEAKDADFFYIDGLHDEGTVIADLINLAPLQTLSKPSVWIFDDFDERFGCFKDILQIISSCNGFKVWNVGLTASGKPSHQAMVVVRFELSENK